MIAVCRDWELSVLALVAGVLTIACSLGGPAGAGDLSYVPLFDGERSDSLNLWGGPFTAGSPLSFTKQSAIVHTGTAAYRANFGSNPAGGNRFFQTFSSALSGAAGYRQDRDLTQYQTLEGWVRNDTPAPLTFSLEIKDYRDSTSHRARRSFTIPANGTWTKIEAPLNLAADWTVDGSPDLTRTFALSFTDIAPTTGSLYLDDFALIENGPSIDPSDPNTPIATIVERLARRQFHALWSARNKTSGIIPNSSDNVAIGALNTTTGVVWMLPAAIRRGWVAQSDADAYMGQLVGSLHANRNQATYLPTRFLDLVSAAPVTDREESSIDAAFVALALHNYKSQPDTPLPLRDSINALESRFDFSAFVRPGGFNLAYFPSSGFSPYSYTGYTNENKVITLAAQLADNVALAGEWNKDVGRVLDHLVDQNQEFLVYSYGTEYRAPFVQALLNLFVDTSDRGVDNFPNRTLARNPWINFQRYEGEVSSKLEQLGRDNFFQPDAGAGAGTYQPWNLFNDFGQPNLFQPWSVAEALMAGAEGSEDALRFLLDNGLGSGLDGPLGLADSAQWATGAADPTSVPSFADNWNMTLSTMALMEFLDSDQRASVLFANLPEVRAALDTVFLDGDLNGNGFTNASDLALWRTGFGTAFRANPAGGDADGDGDVDGLDFLRWQRGFGGSTSAAPAGQEVPEASTLAISIWLLAAAAFSRSRRGTGEG